MKFQLSAFIIFILFLGYSVQALPFLCPKNITDDNISCLIDTNDYSTVRASPSSVKIVEYNVDRNGYGGDSPFERGIEGILSIFKSNGKKSPKNLLISIFNI